MKHTWYECKCGKYDCQFCGGGLGLCTVCGGFEGTLTYECTGKKLQSRTLDAVWKGYIDYKNGRWITGRLWWNGRLHTWDEWTQRRNRGRLLYDSFLNGAEFFSQEDWRILNEYQKMVDTGEVKHES